MQEEASQENLARTSDAIEDQSHRKISADQDANPKRVATFQLIKSVTLATILPLVVEILMRRITVLEHANKSMVELLAELMKALSEA